MAASSERLGNLHALFTGYWENRFMQSLRREDPVPLTAAELAVVRAFLKDNNVFGDPDANGDLDELARNMRKQLTESGVQASELDAIMEDFHRYQQGTVCQH